MSFILFCTGRVEVAAKWWGDDWYKDGSKMATGAGNLSHEATGLGHGGVLFLEPLTETLRALDELVDAAHGATLLFGRELGRGEVVDAVLEAALDEVGVHLDGSFSERIAL